jgi:hypothetical protein
VYKLFVGVDVAKDSSVGHGLNERCGSLFSTAFPMDREGFGKLLDLLKDNCGDLSQVLVAIESIACHHINLFSFLTAKGVTVVVLNPLLVSNFVKLAFRKTKTDKKDARTHRAIRRAPQRLDLAAVRIPGSPGTERPCKGERIFVSADLHKQNRGKKAPSDTIPRVRNDLQSFNQGNARLSAEVSFRPLGESRCSGPRPPA